MANSTLVPGEYVLQDLFNEFTVQVNRKIDALLLDTHVHDSKQVMKSLQRGEDPQFDQLLGALGCVAEYCLPSLLETLFRWFNQCVPSGGIKVEGKTVRPSVKSKNDSAHREQSDTKKDLKEMIISIVFCLVLIEVLQQLSVHPLPDKQIQQILSLAFTHFKNAAMVIQEPTNNKVRIVVDLFAEVIGVMAKTKFQQVRIKFMSELDEARKVDGNTRVIVGLIMGMKFFRVKMYPVEDFEASFRFLRELADYSLETKDREIKHGLASLFVEILVPVAAAVKTEVNVPVLRDFVDALYPTSLELARRKKNYLAMYPLITCLLCVSQKQFFLNHWHIFLDNCLSNLKNRDQKISRVALESLYRLVWAYTVRIKCESNTATQSRLQSIVKALFPAGSRSVVPKDTPLSIYVKIIQFIAQERLDFAMKEIVLDLLCISLTRNTKIMTLQPERMNIGLRAFLVITDSLQQKDGAPPMPTTVGVMPSGNTLRVKKTFLNKMLTEDDARTIGVLQYHKHVQKALDWILSTLDGQVGQRLMMINRTSDVIGVENKPKIDLFRTCIAAMPRLVPLGNMSLTDLFELLSRLTIHIDEDLRSQAVTSLLSFTQDFPDNRDDVIATFVSFILKQVTDIHHVLLEAVVKHLMRLISAWQIKSTHSYTNNSNFTPRSLKSKYTDSYERLSKLSPLIHHLEGFALILLCNNRSATRKLACLLLKEVKEFARSLNFKKTREELCIDVLDRLCPVVTSEVVLDQEIPHYLSTTECKNFLAVAERCDVSALVEYTSQCSSNNNVDLWTSFIASFMKPHRVPASCSASVGFSWANVNLRLNQLFSHMDPIQTSSSKKGNVVPSSSDNILSLWTNYIVFACRSAPTNAAIIKKQAPNPIPAGTSDWLVGLLRDSERITATPSALFQRLITLLRMENNLPLRDSAVIGLGSTSIVAFPDLMMELSTVVQDACKPHRQDNVRRKRKRDNTRVMLARVMERLARHKVLSECSASTAQLPGSSNSSNSKSSESSSLSSIVLDYIKDTCSFLESVDKTEFASATAAGGQQSQQQTPLSPFPGTLHPSYSVQSHSNSSNLMDELRIHFGSMISHLMRHLPDHSQKAFLPDDVRRMLFFLFGRWCGKYGDALDKLDSLDGKDSASIEARLHFTALKAECAVLCSGPLFDKSGLQPDTGYLYPWLEALLDYNNPKIHRLGRDAVVMLLRHNKSEPSLLSWLIDKCYTGSALVSSGCFCSIAAAFNYIDLNNNLISLLNLALFNIANTEISQTAQHLLVMLQSRIVPAVQSQPISNQDLGGGDASNKHKPLQLCLNVNYDRMYTPPLYCLSQYDISQDLARLHPEFTIAMLSEIFKRFMQTTTTVWQQLMLHYILPWLMNLELTLHDDKERVPELNNSERLFDIPLYKLASSGWGSVEATCFIFCNLTYMTIRYHSILGNEIEKCWSTICHSWPNNLNVLLLFISALSSCGGSQSIAFITRKLITFFARAQPKEVAQYLVAECQVSSYPNFTIEILDQPPFLNIDVANVNFNRLRPVKTTSPPHSLSLKNKKNFNILSSSAPTSYMRINMSKSDFSSVSNPLSSRSSKQLYNQLPHHMSLQHLNLNNSTDFDVSSKPEPRPMSVRVKGSSSLYSLPTTNAEVGVHVSPKTSNSNRLSHHEPLTDSQVTKLAGKDIRSTRSVERHRVVNSEGGNSILAMKDYIYSGTNNGDNEFAKWRQQVELGRPCPLPLPSNPLYYFQLNEYFIIDQDKKSNGLLRSNIACVLLSEIVAEHGVVIEWKMYLPILLLSLFLGMDVESEEVPHKCQLLLAHVIIQLLSPKDQAAFASAAIKEDSNVYFGDSMSLSRLKKGVTPTSVSTTDSGIESASSPQKELSLLRSAPRSEEASAPKPFDIHALTSYVQMLLETSRGQLWPAEDVTPRNTSLKSTEKLNAYVSSVVSVVSSMLPEHSLDDKLAKQALRFSTNTHNKHCAGRALQVYRALKKPLRQISINELSLCLSECIADGNDASSQSWAIEILITMLQTCEMIDDLLNKDDPKSSSSNKSQSDNNSITKPPVVNGNAFLAPSTPETKPRSPAMSAKNKKMFRKSHIHRRSGSVSISKQVLEEARFVQPELSPTFESRTTSGEDRNSLPSSNPSDPNSSAAKSKLTPAQLALIDEWKNGLAQIFWIAVGILESDYEHEYLIALHIIQKVLRNLRLNEADGRVRLERSFSQIQWTNFKGLQNLLLKGLTCSVTSETAFTTLSSLTVVSHLALVNPVEDGNGFAINVVALLPRLVNHFGDPDTMCCDCAQNILQVCVEHYKDHSKLKSLAHVMGLYSNNTYNKSVQTWVNVVCKYVCETFPLALSAQLSFLTEMLDKGHSSFHLACLQITHSLLSLSSVLSEDSDGSPVHEILHVVAKQLNSKNWKDALAILKLAVSRSSQLASPASAFTVTQGDSEKEKIELPGLTFAFNMDLPESPPEMSPRKSPDGKEISSPVGGGGWRRPHLSQRRTRERLRCVLSVCSISNLQDQMQPLRQNNSDHDIALSGQLTDLLDDGTSPEKENSVVEEKAVEDYQYHAVLRGFDFLNEIDEMDGESTEFNQGMHWNSSNPSPGASNDALETNDADEPVECDMTPALSHHDPEDEEEPQISSSSDDDSASSYDDSSTSHRDINPASQSSSSEELDSEDKTDNLLTGTLNGKSKPIGHARAFSGSVASPSTYIRAESPNPPGSSKNKAEKRVFSPRKSVTDQVNSLHSDFESASSDENPSTEEQAFNDPLPPPIIASQESTSTPLPPDSQHPSDKDRLSSSSFQSLEERSNSSESLAQMSKSDSLDLDSWIDCSLLHAKNLRWKMCLLAVVGDLDGSALSRFFVVFPSIYRSLCLDFSVLSKKCCDHLGVQLSNISGHFSSMVDNLPKQLECPLCVATTKTYCMLMEQLKSHLADLEEQLDFYSNRQEMACDCLELITKFISGEMSSNEELQADDFSLDHKQLELCRLLYTLHFQLLLIFQSFNRLVHVVSSSFPKDVKVTDHLLSLHKELLAGELLKNSSTSPNPEEMSDVEDEIRSMTNEEACLLLLASLQNEDFRSAQVQISVLRKLWPMETFGDHDDSSADFLVDLYFHRVIGARSSGTTYVIIGENASGQNLCEKLMEVNMQIQHSLKLLEKPRVKGADARPQSTNDNPRTLAKPLDDISSKRTSF